MEVQITLKRNLHSAIAIRKYNYKNYNSILLLKYVFDIIQYKYIQIRQ